MTGTIVPIGKQIALDVRDSSGRFSPSGLSLNTLSDLLDILGRNPPKSLPMLRSTCSKFADYVQLPADKITIDSIFEKRENFLLFLKSRTYGKNSVRSYANYIRILLTSAEEFGWHPNEAFPEAWRGVLALAPERKCSVVAKYLARIRKSPAEVTIQDVDNWARLTTEQGRSHNTRHLKKTLIWRLLRDCGSTEQTPISLLREKRYGIPTKQLPLELKKELVELLRWKQVLIALGRPPEARHRAITARNLESATCALIGFALNIAGQSDVTSLSQIAT